VLVAASDPATRPRCGPSAGRISRGLAGALEAAEIAAFEPSEPDRVRIGLVEEDWPSTQLPWDGPGIAAVRRRLASVRPRRVWHLGAWSGDASVGHATVNVTTGRLGVAGIYDMGVAEHERRRGIGRSLTLAALELGRRAGCAMATLNATPEGELLYRQLAFRSVGVAQTWWR
jgi:GNAT superfamily N-acetyltransferase